MCGAGPAKCRDVCNCQLLCTALLPNTSSAACTITADFIPGNPSTSRRWSRMLCIGFTTEHNGWDEMQYQTQPQNSKRIELKLTISLSRAIFQVNIVINQLHIYAIFPWPGCFILGMHDTDIVDYMSMVPEIIFTL